MSGLGWPTPSSAGGSRRAEQTPPQATGGAAPRTAVTIGVAALLELAAWCRDRLTEPPGETTCPPRHGTPPPPAPAPPVGDGPAPGPGAMGPTPRRHEAAAPRPARPPARPAPRGEAPRGGRP